MSRNTPSRARPIAKDDEDSDGEYVDESVPVPTVEAEEESDGRSTPMSTRNRISRRNESETIETPIRPVRPVRRPKNDYPVPQGLEGVCRALGEVNWNDYLILMEKRCLETISEAEFAAKASHIFSAHDEATKRRVEGLVMRKVILPVLQARNEQEILQSGEAEGS